jgi:N-carbamoyl-L-amino-acid hydrolase
VSFDPARPLADLRALAALTSDERGAQRVCWTDGWVRAREWLRERLTELDAEVEVDEAGNLWASPPGTSAAPGAVLVGSHVDSVPGGGWLDGALGICAALEALRAFAGTPGPPLRLVDWADEEGARFGRSLLGSSAAAGTLQPDEVRGLRDRDGRPLPDVLAEHGVDLDRAPLASSRLDGPAAYLELHIEQGPVLERLGQPAGAVVGTVGVERHALTVAGQAAHAGSTPLDLRHDALLAAARLALAAREGARRHGGVATVGRLQVAPGLPTVIGGRCELTLDQRALDAGALGDMLDDARAAGERIAAEEGVEVGWEPLWRIEPIPFAPALPRTRSPRRAPR